MIKHYDKNTQGRDFVVGDIHGCFTRLSLSLGEIGFDCAVDRLFSVGDLIDRGNESELVTEWIGKPWFFPVRGNHDDFAIRHVRIGKLDYENYARNGGAWFMALPAQEQESIVTALETLPHGISVETNAGLAGIVHADIPYSTWSQLKSELCGEFSKSRTKTRAITDYLMWSRDRAETRNSEPITDLAYLIVGHTPLREIGYLGNVIYIDTMGWREDGKFTILNLNEITTHNR